MIVVFFHEVQQKARPLESMAVFYTHGLNRGGLAVESPADIL
jgi:hypothetical protein